MLSELYRSIIAERYAIRNGLPGIQYAKFGRKLALRQVILRKTISFNFLLNTFINPVSCVRYLEFDFIGKSLLALDQNYVNDAEILDISSPRLFPFWMADVLGAKVTMINPDRSDLLTSIRVRDCLRKHDKLSIYRKGDGTKLPFIENNFDIVTSISVIEHINNYGDRKMMDELVRVTRPGGKIFLTFPVKPDFENEYRDNKCYETQALDPISNKYFFQRYYDRESIDTRLLFNKKALEVSRRYYVEDPPNWFSCYEKKWIENGVKITALDPMLMVDHFKDMGDTHPIDRMGVCCLALTVDK